jgi:MFS family permease
MSLLVLATAGTTPIGAPIMGWISSHWGARSALAVGGVGTALATLAVAGWLRSRTMRQSTELTAALTATE